MAWIIKMLLKVFKPFAKIMIMQALLEYFTETATEEEPDASDAPAEDTAE